MLNVLVLNASLTRNTSRTKFTCQLLLEQMQAFLPIQSEIVDLLDLNLLPVIGSKVNGVPTDDDWATVLDKIKHANIVVFATPIWWGTHSSLLQRVIERMDDLTDRAGYAQITNSVAGIVISGAEDGGQATQAGLMCTMTYFGFYQPPYTGYFDLDKTQPPNLAQLDVTAKSLIREALRVRNTTPSVLDEQRSTRCRPGFGRERG